MKHYFLFISLSLTIFVFSMSFVSGDTSGSMSLGVTELVYRILNSIVPNNTVDIAILHIFVRKTAHVVEYMVLAISWYFTIKAWKLSLFILLLTGLIIASIDEIIQLYAIERGSSVIDVLVFDFMPFALTSTLLVLINNLEGKEIMYSTTLARLKANEISPEKAYKELFKREGKIRVPFFKRAHFIKLRIRIPEQRGVNTFLAVLFFIPMPILFLRIIMGFIKLDRFSDDIPLTKRELINLIAYKGVRIKVNAKSGEKILIRTI